LNVLYACLLILVTNWVQSAGLVRRKGYIQGWNENFRFRENFRENLFSLSRKYSSKNYTKITKKKFMIYGRIFEIFAKTKNFSERNFVKFHDNLPIFAWFSHFRENGKIHFRFNPRYIWWRNLFLKVPPTVFKHFLQL
jgi:hypothetical protein